MRGRPPPVQSPPAIPAVQSGKVEAYPNVQLELCGDDNFIDIVEEGFDAEIRMARSVPMGMIAVPLTPRIRFAVVAAASYVRKRGRPSRPRELEQFNCIQLRRSTGSSTGTSSRTESRSGSQSTDRSSSTISMCACAPFCEESVLPDCRFRW